MINLDDLRERREWAVFTHRDWKRRSWVSDLIAKNEWHVVWGDDTISNEEPLVENLYLEALEDKAATAASIKPRLLVSPTRGTRADRAELNAQKRRRAFNTFLQRSNFETKLTRWYLDWWQHGAMYAMPFTDFNATERYVTILRMDPRQAYPLTHDSNDNLTSIFFSRNRRFADLEQEWGHTHPALVALRKRRERRNVKSGTPIEEIWWYDNRHMAVALYEDNIPEFASQYRYVSPLRTSAIQEPAIYEWLLPPTEHKLSTCPVVETKRHSADGEYRGALDVMIPTLRLAQNLAARQLDDIELQIFAPVVIEGVINEEDYGPGAKLIGDGTGRARVEYSRPPMAFDASQKIAQALEATRNVGKYPMQRQGEFGASIASAKGVNAVMGTFNTEIAWAQRDITVHTQNMLARAAEFDEAWCPGSKRIDGFDEGEMYDETYNPKTLWQGDYRCYVTFGGGLGMDQQGFLLTLSTARNMEGLAMRSFMTKSGLVDNALAEERELVLEKLVNGYLDYAQQQASEGGNPIPLYEIATAVDDDKSTVRAAIIDVIKKAQAGVPTSGPPESQAGALDPVSAARAMSTGGVPGGGGELGAMGPPSLGPSAAGLLPPGALANIGAELGPGGTAA